ncbi:FecCD family ABC transporter permease [Nesterenkonia muleiensis]|uniref:FecCD family ABC transporter permease n=1 Tax=Nesterenkonia muleiensis TaxID=2282648 RepID=UPI001EE3D045|nr:iron chelate uptake ABC transporter family permease subunit [Nesterenkonia muleiensis]
MSASSKATPVGTVSHPGQGRSRRHVVLRASGRSLKVERRTLSVCAVMLAVCAGLGTAGLLLGDYPLTVRQVIGYLFGDHTDPLAGFFVREQRLPRVLLAVLVGAALGVSGQVFQSLSGNPLGSPDIIGFTTGSATGAVLQIIVFDAGPAGAAGGALLGGFATALVVYLLAHRGGVSGLRLVLVGIGIGLMLGALNTLLVARASLVAAQTAAQWLAGSLNATTWSQVGLVSAALVLLLPMALVRGRTLTAMTLGDASAAALGIRPERQRLVLVVCGVALVAVATAACGPIAFIALAAPQLARRLTRSSGAGLLPAALMGACLVLGSDILAQRLFAPTQLAVGVVSGTLGGIYLIWLLAMERSRL